MKFIITKKGYEAVKIEKANMELAKKQWNNLKQEEAMRTCWQCNEAHAHLINSKKIWCIECGKVYFRGIDVTEYGGTEYEEQSKSNIL